MTRIPVRGRLTITFAMVMAVVLLAAGVFVHQREQANLDAAIATTLRARSADLAALAQQSDSGLKDAARSGSVKYRAQLAQIFDAKGRLIDQTAGLGQQRLIPTSASTAARWHEVTRNSRLGSLPIRVLASPVRAQDQTLVIVVGQSLAERNAALHDLASVLLMGGPAALLLASLAGYALIGAALRPVELMRRRERAFVADASHELRTPLTVLRGELELIGRDQPTGEELRETVASAVEETERLTRLADDLLLLTRADHDQPIVHAAPERAAELLRAAARRADRRNADCRVQVEADSDAIVLVDRDRLGQALDNLVDNALRYAHTAVALEAREHDGVVELHVIDDGPGFPSDFLPRAWDRFSRADNGRADGGTGLGLAIVQAVVEMNGGSAHAANRTGGGADVWLTLPAIPLPRARSADAPERATA
jgi:signal transduction histidine kinase